MKIHEVSEIPGGDLERHLNADHEERLNDLMGMTTDEQTVLHLKMHRLNTEEYERWQDRDRMWRMRDWVVVVRHPDREAITSTVTLGDLLREIDSRIEDKVNSHALK
jgi:hypothetical protein